MATPSPALLARLREAAQDPTKRDAVFAAIAADPVLGPELDDLSDEDLIAASATVAAPRNATEFIPAGRAASPANRSRWAQGPTALSVRQETYRPREFPGS